MKFALIIVSCTIVWSPIEAPSEQIALLLSLFKTKPIKCFSLRIDIISVINKVKVVSIGLLQRLISWRNVGNIIMSSYRKDDTEQPTSARRRLLSPITNCQENTRLFVNSMSQLKEVITNG